MHPSVPLGCVSAPVDWSRTNTATAFPAVALGAADATYTCAPSGLTVTPCAPRSPRPLSHAPEPPWSVPLLVTQRCVSLDWDRCPVAGSRLKTATALSG